MSTFTKNLTAVNDKALAIVTALHNAAMPEGVAALTEHEYLNLMLDGVLKSWQDQYIRVPSAEFLLRFPAGKVDAIKAVAAGGNAQLQAYIDEIRAAPYVYTGSTLVRSGVAMLVSAGLITQAQADEILA
jgi:hypothetical protein